MSHFSTLGAYFKMKTNFKTFWWNTKLKFIDSSKTKDKQQA